MVMFRCMPIRWRVPEYKDSLGRDTRLQYQSRISNASYAVWLKYEKVAGNEMMELPANARPSRKRLFAKLNRYRMVGRKK